MSLGLLVRPSAWRDIQAAYRHYEAERRGLGLVFEEELNGAVARILANPFSYSRVYGNVRRAILNRFPYGVFYRRHRDVLHVLAVLHLSRHPSSWQRRG